jgi:hypothetical protein
MLIIIAESPPWLYQISCYLGNAGLTVVIPQWGMAEKPKPSGIPVKRAVTDTPSPEEEVRDDVALTIRISRELRDALYVEAKATHRSINSLLTICAETVFQAQGKWPPKESAPETLLDRILKGKAKS